MSFRSTFQANCAKLILDIQIYKNLSEQEEKKEIGVFIEENWANLSQTYEGNSNWTLRDFQSFKVAQEKAAKYFIKNYNINILNPTAQQIQDLKIRSQRGCITFCNTQPDPLTNLFSNRFICPEPIEFGGRGFSNAESIYQAQKAQELNPSIFEQITENTTGEEAVALTRQIQLTNEWDAKKDDVMMNCQRAKFGQNEFLKKALLATNQAYLLNHPASSEAMQQSDEPYHWGTDSNGSGKNGLGICLMRLREEYGGAGISQTPEHDPLQFVHYYIPKQLSANSSIQSPVFAMSQHEQKVEQIRQRARSEGVIAFYDDKTDSLTGLFGNFHPIANVIEFDGKQYSNSEAIFQAQKMKHAGRQDILSQFNAQTTGDIAVQLGRTAIPSDKITSWDQMKIEVMMHCLRAKFGQNQELKSCLLATEAAYLIEHLPDAQRRDKFWSDAYNGSGAAPNGYDSLGGNHLGICLMKLRAEFGGSDVTLRPKHDLSKLEKFYTSKNVFGSAFQNLGQAQTCCKLPGCNKPVYSVGMDYCGRTHAQQHLGRPVSRR